MKRDKLLKVMRPNDDPIESLRGDGVDLSAPGHKILAITSDNRNAKSHGTSFSAALVSGAVALMRAGFPGWIPKRSNGSFWRRRR
jgi:subtilisin family serine protease